MPRRRPAVSARIFRGCRAPSEQSEYQHLPTSRRRNVKLCQVFSGFHARQSRSNISISQHRADAISGFYQVRTPGSAGSRPSKPVCLRGSAPPRCGLNCPFFWAWPRARARTTAAFFRVSVKAKLHERCPDPKRRDWIVPGCLHRYRQQCPYGLQNRATAHDRSKVMHLHRRGLMA